MKDYLTLAIMSDRACWIRRIFPVNLQFVWIKGIWALSKIITAASEYIGTKCVFTWIKNSTMKNVFKDMRIYGKNKMLKKNVSPPGLCITNLTKTLSACNNRCFHCPHGEI